MTAKKKTLNAQRSTLNAKMRMRAAHTAYRRAAEALVRTTAECYPIGKTIAVTLGRPRIVGRIIAAGGHWWSNPGNVEIENVATGKRRHFSGSDHHGVYRPEFLPQ